MTYDFNEAGEQRSYDVIPEGLVAVIQLNIRAGDAGADGLLTRAKDGRSEGLDCEFIIVEGPHAKRKFWMRLTLSGTTEGHSQAADISHRTLRAILESRPHRARPVRENTQGFPIRPRTEERRRGARPAVP